MIKIWISSLSSGLPYTPRGVLNGALNYVEFRAAMYPMWYMARPARLERATCGFVVRRSIQLSYGRDLADARYRELKTLNL